jgi:uncharacterized membrane protein
MFNKVIINLLALIYTVGLDYIYLKFIGMRIFQQFLGDLLRKNILLAPGIMVWVLIVLGSYVFVYDYAIKNIFQALLYGAFYGLVLYGVYELTNYSILSAWNSKIVLIDLLWGVILNMLIALFWHFVGGNGFLKIISKN